MVAFTREGGTTTNSGPADTPEHYTHFQKEQNKLQAFIRKYELGAEQGVSGYSYNIPQGNLDFLGGVDEYNVSALGDFLTSKGFSNPHDYLKALDARMTQRKGQSLQNLLTPGAQQQTKHTTSIRSLLV